MKQKRELLVFGVTFSSPQQAPDLFGLLFQHCLVLQKIIFSNGEVLRNTPPRLQWRQETAVPGPASSHRGHGRGPRLPTERGPMQTSLEAKLARASSSSHRKSKWRCHWGTSDCKCQVSLSGPTLGKENFPHFSLLAIPSTRWGCMGARR